MSCFHYTGQISQRSNCRIGYIGQQLEHSVSESDVQRSVPLQKQIILYVFEDHLEISLISKFIHCRQNQLIFVPDRSGTNAVSMKKVRSGTKWKVILYNENSRSQCEVGIIQLWDISVFLESFSFDHLRFFWYLLLFEFYFLLLF